jgi:tetratricopeptide (TPR) repeat protein
VAQPAARHLASAEAEEAFQRGRAVLATRRNLNDAMLDFRLAARLDSTHARAWAGLAEVYAMAHAEPGLAENAARRAIELDPELADAWASLGFALAFQSWNWPAAERALRRALEIEPTSTKALQWLSTIRMVQRRFDESVGLLDRALTLEARPGLYADLCQAEYYRGRPEAARAACDRARRLDAGFAATDYIELRMALTAGHAAEAAAHVERLGLPRLQAPGLSGVLQTLIESTSDPSQGPNRHVGRAEWSALAGDDEAALSAVERAVEQRAFMAPFLNADPLLDPVRDHPRFRASMRQIGIAP